MSTYFDHLDPSHLKLLRAGHRAHEDLEMTAELAEADVIGFFTERPPEILYTRRIGVMTGDGLVTGATGRYEDITTKGLPTTALVPERRVYLLGYKADAGHPDVDPALKLALRRAIAEVINWRLSLLGKDVAVDSTGDDKKSRAYAANAQDQMPPEWSRWLVNYDSREGVVGL